MQDSKPSGSSERVFTKPEGQNMISCFHCKPHGHRAMECPKRIHLIENESDAKDTPDDPTGKVTEAKTEE